MQDTLTTMKIEHLGKQLFSQETIIINQQKEIEMLRIQVAALNIRMSTIEIARAENYERTY